MGWYLPCTRQPYSNPSCAHGVGKNPCHTPAVCAGNFSRCSSACVIASKRHSSTSVALRAYTAKLIPAVVSDAPSGSGSPRVRTGTSCVNSVVIQSYVPMVACSVVISALSHAARTLPITAASEYEYAEQNRSTLPVRYPQCIGGYSLSRPKRCHHYQ